MKIILFLFLWLIIPFAGCDFGLFGLEPGLGTEVNGRVYDAIKDKYLANAKVLLLSCGRTSIGISCASFMDSTFTDENGNFHFSFNTQKGDFGYEVHIEVTEDITNDRYQAYSVEVGPGKSNNVILHARELNYLQTHLQVIENNFSPLVAICQNSVRLVYHTNNDTTLLLRVLPQAHNHIIFSVYDSQVGSYRQRIDTLNVDMQDTVFYDVVCKVSDFELN